MNTLLSLALLFSALFLPAACQFDNGEGDNGFHPDPLTAGLFGILCVFVFVFGAFTIWSFIALLISRGHRSPYALLFPTLILFAWSNGTYIALIVLENIPSLQIFADTLPVLLLPVLSFLSRIFNNWALVLQYLAVLAVVWNRERALRTATEGTAGVRHPVRSVVHAVLATLMLVFGTAAEGLNLDTNVQYYTGGELRLDRKAILHRILVYQQLTYVFATFAVLSGVDVAVSASLLWRAWRRAEMRDKITNLMLYAVVPLYSALCIIIMAFTIVFSPSGLPDSATIETFEGAYLADSLLTTLFSLGVIGVLLAMSAKRTNWRAGGIEEPGKRPYGQWTVQPQYAQPQYGQPQYGYAAPPSQPGVYAATPGGTQPGQPTVQYTSYEKHTEPHGGI
ncbi:hypothetical protein B0H10DRAFT_215982 [Mycena sp. CBHHK59/15]|nr:hypothetical protein B0H10DRAFT_215982 [Mycena sp. CBHHK59/15]